MRNERHTWRKTKLDVKLLVAKGPSLLFSIASCLEKRAS